MKILITGGAGFIGVNAAHRFASKGHRVTVYDNLSRRGTRENLKWLKENHPDIEFVRGDTRDYGLLSKRVKNGKFGAIIHLAAQVAVTTSVVNPREDFEINALGTFNLLEAVRNSGTNPAILYSSTNKVYGGMTDIKITKRNGRYEYKSLPQGIKEERLLDFHSPYGCSKGTADQYMIDYARIYGLRTVVFRQSCIYGYRQFGIEDQGWVAWFVIAAALGKKLTIYGDGMQVRDVLFIDDLVDAYEAAIKNMDKIKGNAFNIGGGPRNKMSLLELLAFLEKFYGKKIPVKYAGWRPGDQPVFVCDVSKAKKMLKWAPKTSPEQGVKKLYEWVKENKDMFESIEG